MNRLFLYSVVYFLLAVASLLYAATTSGQETATWSGTLEVGGGQKLRLEFNITRKDGKRSGTLKSLDQNNAVLKLDDIQVDAQQLKFSIPRIGATFEGKLENKGLTAKGTYSQSGNKLPLVLTQSKPDKTETKPKEKLIEAWVGKLQLGTINPVMQFRILKDESGEKIARFDSVTEGRTGFPATWSIKDKKIKFEVEKVKLVYEGTLNESGNEATGTWKQGGRKLSLTLKKQATEFKEQFTWKNRPQRPKGKIPYDALEVKFENKKDKLTLAGTLTLPKKPGKHPVVILISGSGPQDRDETLMEHKPFLVIADYLTRRGIGVLRYDDRGTAKSTGKFSGSTTRDFATDASAAVDFLLTHPRVNPEQIGLAGHSEGGLIAPMVTQSRTDVAFVVLLAATGVDGRKISLSQTEAMLRVNGTEEEDIKMALMVSGAVLKVAANLNSGDDFDKKILEAVEAAIKSEPESKQKEVLDEIRREMPSIKKRVGGNWMRFFLNYDPRPALREIKCPVLALIGSKDVQVLPKLNMPEIKKALKEGGNKDFETVEFKDLNHLFQKCKTGSLDEYHSIGETFNPAVLKKMGDWIESHVK